MKKALIALALLGQLALATTGHADTETCARAYETGQMLRKDSKLIDARRDLVVCAQDGCPAVLRKDCVTWLSQVEEIIPKISVNVRGRNGCDRPDAKVFIDETEVPNAAKGLPIDIDPGSHSLRVTVDGQTTGSDIVVTSGERQRVVTLTLAPEGVTCGAPPPPADKATRGTASRGTNGTENRREHTVAYVLSGVGIAAALVGTGFGISAWNQKSTLDDCKGACAKSDVDTMQRTFLVADIGAGVAIVSLAAAAAFYFFAR